MANSTRSVSVRTSIRVSLFGLLLAVGATALIGHEFLRREDFHQAAHERTRVLAETVAVQLDAAGPQGLAKAQDICNALLESPSMMAVCIWDSDGTRLACAGRDEKQSSLLQGLRTRPALTTGDTHFWLNHSVESDAGPMDAHFVKVGMGTVGGPPPTLGVLLDMGPMLGSMSRHTWFFYGPVILVGALALAVGSWWMRREVAGPITSLVGIAGKDLDARDDATAFERYEEIGELARSLHALKLDALTWRRKAETTERRADSRVANETKRITRDLQRVQQQAWDDQLTEVYNRRFLDEEMPKVFDAQRASNRDLAVVMIDLDHFKKLNDTAGHAAGDEILRFTGELIKQCTRTSDFAVRYGGDEFLIVMPGASAARATVVAERILAHFTQRVKVMVDVRPAPSLTAGIASIANNQPATLVEAIAMADDALLTAKQDGKACVRMSDRRGHVNAAMRMARSA